MTKGEAVSAFIEKYCRVPEGARVGGRVELLPFQREIILGIFDSDPPPRRVIVSMGRKNAKSCLTAMLLLAAIAGPAFRPNAQVYSSAQSRDQAAIIFGYAAKMVRMDEDLSLAVHVKDTAKELIGLRTGVHYKALSADATTAHGTSPALVIHDETGRVRGPRSELYDALETGMGAHKDPLSIIISTQAPDRRGSAQHADRQRQGFRRPDHEVIPVGGRPRRRSVGRGDLAQGKSRARDDPESRGAAAYGRAGEAAAGAREQLPQSASQPSLRRRRSLPVSQRCGR